MENGKKMYELIELMNDRQGIANDISSSASMLRDSLERRYVSKLHSIVDSEEEKVKRQPPREIALIRALKGFVNPSTHESMDNIISALTAMDVIRNIDSSFNSSENTIYNLSEDGENGTLPQKMDITSLKLLLMLTALGRI
ncbi:MAG: hypothetical protein VB120_04230 [Lachnospiraceae bacterium]|nr:hypothetical protein [Lachnospiraceae bacterium]